jgi:exodeoxyribonuclease V gamma subunit
MLTVHRAERADRLVEALASVVIDPLPDPFTSEVVAVPTRGIERWLTQCLSTVLGTSPDRHDGVCANIDFPFPGRVVSGAMAAATDIDPDDDPWLPERALWPLMEVVDEHLGDGWMAALAAHLGGATDPADETMRNRRFGAVRHLADLFDRYAVHRPSMIAAWVAGDDTDGSGGVLPPDVAWQATLWRHLRDRLAVPSPAERLTAGSARLREDPDLSDLPPRMSLFGLTRLPASHVEVLDALATARDVHLFLLHPSPDLWTRISAETSTRSLVPRADDPTAALPRNPLLAIWGRDSREMQLVLGARGTDVHHAAAAATGTLLQRIQAGVRADAAPPGPPIADEADQRLLLDPSDHSLRVHSCHGRARQVEVLRDAILHLLADDPTLEPRDVIVMCPDIETFAPLIQATFRAIEVADLDEETSLNSGRLPDLRVRLADRSLRQTNPVLGAVSELLTLVDARITASQLLDFASREPVRRMFRLDDEDLERLENWIASTGIRWGLDAAHRAPYQLDALAENTWRAGLDRLLLGVTMAEDDLRLVGNVLPLDDVDSGDIEFAGRFAELVDRIQTAVDELSRPKPIEAWIRAIVSAAGALTATSDRDAWQHAELDRILSTVITEAGAAGASTDLSLVEVRALLADQLRGRPTRANFRTGHLTICTLVPMRSVPHRVVCLLGLDDGVFPRRTAPDGDDIIERAPCVGDRDPRSEDRQLLLDALLAATDHLVITYSGRDERTNAVRPPAVPLGELLDVVDLTARAASRSARDQVCVHHPLQPFDPRNFSRGELVAGQPWSFDAVALDGACASVAGPAAQAPFLPEPLAPVDNSLVEIDDLVRFVRHPVKAFLRQRLEVSVSDVDDEPADALPVALDHLERWSVGDRILELRLAGYDADTCVDAEVARGGLPPGTLGDLELDGLLPVIDDIYDVAMAAVDATATTESVEVNVDLGDGRSVVGTVPGVVGSVVRVATFSKVAPKHRLAAWVRLLALAVAHPDRSFTAVTVGRGKHDRAGVARIGPIAADAALEQLRILVDLHARGMREPLPLYCATSAAYASASPAVRINKARDEWRTQPRGFPNEDRDRAHLLVLGDNVPFDDLLLAAPNADEAGAGWAADETTRFGRYARRLWDGLLAHEELDNL